MHAIASLWMYQREQGEQGILKKSDICRVLEIEKDPCQETDKEILERYKKEGVTEIQFLSHSYFGEQDNNLHFQHQSFAEILLAEYYLKVFIKYALDETPKIHDARNKFMLGEPTGQTISFFKELILLLKSTVSNEATPTIIEKRRLLFPLIASLAHKKHNKLYCTELYYEWFKQVKIDDIKSSKTPPKKLLENWVIDENALEKMLFLAKEIIDEKSTILSAKSSSAHALFNNELTVLHNKLLRDIPTDIDKWLSLVLGNLLGTDVSEKRFFNARLSNPENLFEMIRNWNYSKGWSSPYWASDYFNGIKMKGDNDEIDLSNLRLEFIDFSYSLLENLYLHNIFSLGASFNECTFNNVSLSSSKLLNVKFDNINILDQGLYVNFAQIYHGILMPDPLAYYLGEVSSLKSDSMHHNFVDNQTFLNFSDDYDTSGMIFDTLKGLLQFGLNKNLFTIKDIKGWFRYNKKQDEQKFEALLDTLNEPTKSE